MNKFTTEVVKGSSEYRVTSEDGTVIARSHCVQVQAKLFTVVVGGKWAGILPEDKAIAHLRGMC